MTGVVIIGAGECGVRAAFALRDCGYEGSVTLIGEEDALPYERPPLSKVLGQIKPVRPARDYDDAGICLRLGTRVDRIDCQARRIVLKTGDVLGYDRLLIATGARARLFPGMEGCLTLRTDADAQGISEVLHPGSRVGIVGGGFIGLELAALVRTQGVDVTLIEADTRLLSRAVPEDIAEIVKAKHRANGVLIDCGIKVLSAGARHITIAGGSNLSFDAVIVGVGALPNTELAETAGLAVQNGIVVDRNFRTSDPHVFAAGDCCSFEWRGTRVRLESWKAAQDQGAQAAYAMLGTDAPYAKVPWFWSDQYELTLQVAGLFDMSRPVTRRVTPQGQCIVFQCAEDGSLSAAAGIGPGNSIAKDIRIFEKLIEKGQAVDTQTLADPAQNLKRLLRAA